MIEAGTDKVPSASVEVVGVLSITSEFVPLVLARLIDIVHPDRITIEQAASIIITR